MKIVILIRVVEGGLVQEILATDPESLRVFVHDDDQRSAEETLVSERDVSALTKSDLLETLRKDARNRHEDEGDSLHQCQNCGTLYLFSELTNPVPDLQERVAPGEPMPSGECPEADCRAVCHPAEEG
jgi:hypothetical protein